MPSILVRSEFRISCTCCCCPAVRLADFEEHQERRAAAMHGHHAAVTVAHSHALGQRTVRPSAARTKRRPNVTAADAKTCSNSCKGNSVLRTLDAPKDGARSQKFRSVVDYFSFHHAASRAGYPKKKKLFTPETRSYRRVRPPPVFSATPRCPRFFLLGGPGSSPAHGEWSC